MTIKVGRERIRGPKPRFFAYRDIPYLLDGWVDASKYLPADFDLVYLELKDKPDTCGWSTGNSWDGATVKPTDKIIRWKRKFDEPH